MQPLTRLETIIQERKEKETAKKDYIKQYHQYAKRLWFIPYLLKLGLLTLFALFFYFLGYKDSPVCSPCPICEEKRPFIIKLPATGAE
jgi:hypothetical protein